MTPEESLKRRIRWTLLFFTTALVISGLTAFPIQWQLNLIGEWVQQKAASGSNFFAFVDQARLGVDETYRKYPFIGYGTDWLAFAHIVIGVAFIGPMRDPVRNKWVLQWGMIACLMVFPLALICAPLRDIPLMWALIDCCFGLFGIIPLWLSLRWTKQLESHKITSS